VFPIINGRQPQSITPSASWRELLLNMRLELGKSDLPCARR